MKLYENLLKKSVLIRKKLRFKLSMVFVKVNFPATEFGLLIFGLDYFPREFIDHGVREIYYKAN